MKTLRFIFIAFKLLLPVFPAKAAKSEILINGCSVGPNRRFVSDKEVADIKEGKIAEDGKLQKKKGAWPRLAPHVLLPALPLCSICSKYNAESTFLIPRINATNLPSAITTFFLFKLT